MLRAAVLGGAVGDLDERQEISDGIFFRCFALLHSCQGAGGGTPGSKAKVLLLT